MNLTYTLRKSPDFVFDYLTDMDKFMFIHPLINKIDHLGNGRYLVHETMQMGFIPYSFTYPVTIESDAKEHHVVMKATVMKMTHIEMDYVIRAQGEGSIVEETITFRSILPIKGMMEKLFREQHALLFRNMNNV